MARKKRAKKAEAPKKELAGTSRPRTVRLAPEDEEWIDGQTHPQGFSGVLRDAVRHYRAHKDETRKALLEAIA